MKLAKNISIVVITHNRSEFVARMAAALNSMDYGGDLILAESSSGDGFEKTSDLLSSLKLKINIKHIHVPKLAGMTISQSMNKSFEQGIELIETDYAMLTCDDDIPIPTTLEKCQKFLDQNHLYNGVIGELAWLDVQSIDKGNRLLAALGVANYVRCNPTFGLEKFTASERLDEYLESFFHTMFAVVRVATYKNIFPTGSNKVTFPHFCADYNWMFGIALSGRIKHLKLPQVIRQMHGANLGIKGPSHPFPSYLESLITSAWGGEAKWFVDNLAKLIKRVDGVNEDTAFDIALEGFRKLTILRLTKQKSPTLLKRLISKFYVDIGALKYRIAIFDKCRLYRSAISAITKYNFGF